MIDLLWPLTCAACSLVGQGRLCARCREVCPTALTPPEGLRALWVLGPYDGPLGEALRRAKFRPDRRAAVALSALLALHAPAADLVVPAPSTWPSRWRRGFSCASVLAGAVARAQGVPLVHALSVQRGPPQASLSGRTRRQSLRGRVNARRLVAGHVLLVDDVVTTGATLRACAQELLCSGARSVSALVLCSANQPFAPELSETPVQTL